MWRGGMDCEGCKQHLPGEILRRRDTPERVISSDCSTPGIFHPMQEPAPLGSPDTLTTDKPPPGKYVTGGASENNFVGPF